MFSRKLTSSAFALLVLVACFASACERRQHTYAGIEDYHTEDAQKIDPYAKHE